MTNNTEKINLLAKLLKSNHITVQEFVMLLEPTYAYYNYPHSTYPYWGGISYGSTTTGNITNTTLGSNKDLPPQDSANYTIAGTNSSMNISDLPQDIQDLINNQKN